MVFDNQRPGFNERRVWIKFLADFQGLELKQVLRNERPLDVAPLILQTLIITDRPGGLLFTKQLPVISME